MALTQPLSCGKNKLVLFYMWKVSPHRIFSGLQHGGLLRYIWVQYQRMCAGSKLAQGTEADLGDVGKPERSQKAREESHGGLWQWLQTGETHCGYFGLTCKTTFLPFLSKEGCSSQICPAHLKFILMAETTFWYLVIMLGWASLQPSLQTHQQLSCAPGAEKSFSCSGVPFRGHRRPSPTGLISSDDIPASSEYGTEGGHNFLVFSRPFIY